MGRKHFLHGHHGSPVDLATMRLRFLSFCDKIDGENGCWLWNGKVPEGRYPNFMLWRRSKQSNRVAWILFVGPIPRGMSVLHHCDIKKCANPKHLWLGDHEDNMRDMHQKKRDRWHNKGKSPQPWTSDDYLRFIEGRVP
jgi:hypothetical protein